MKGYYVVWDTSTGVYDGAYAHIEEVMALHKRMVDTNPAGKWVVVQIVYSPQGQALADEKFYANQFITE